MIRFLPLLILIFIGINFYSCGKPSLSEKEINNLIKSVKFSRYNCDGKQQRTPGDYDYLVVCFDRKKKDISPYQLSFTYNIVTDSYIIKQPLNVTYLPRGNSGLIDESCGGEIDCEYVRNWKGRHDPIEASEELWSGKIKEALRRSNIEGKFHDLRKTFASRLYFLTGAEFTLCRALGHTDTSMTMQYTNLDKVELARAFPDIVAMKNANSGVKKPVRGHNQGDTELYSNFGFMHVT